MYAEYNGCRCSSAKKGAVYSATTVLNCLASVPVGWHIMQHAYHVTATEQKRSGTRAPSQYKDVILLVGESPLWRKDGRQTVLFPQWDYPYQ